MKIFDRDDYLALAEKKGEWVFSLYLPTNTKSNDAYQADKIHFKNLLSQIEKELKEHRKLGEREIKKLLGPAEKMLDHHDFWKFNADMLAFFIINGEIDYYRLPLEMKEPRFFIGKKPYLLPMIPELNDDGHYYVVHLNLNRFQLFEGTRSTLREITLDAERMPLSFIEEEKELEKQSHLQGQGNVGQAGKMYHGQGGGSEEEKKVDILNYFNRLCKELEPVLHKNPLPTYPVGVDYLIPIFEKACRYPHLMKESVKGSFREDDLEKIRQMIWQQAATHFSKEREKRMEEFEGMRSKNQAVKDDPMKLIKAALTGAVDTLFVRKDHPYLWGAYNAEKHHIELQETFNGENHCLVDLAATATKVNKGKVYLEEPENMPGEAEIAGIFRYEL